MKKYDNNSNNNNYNLTFLTIQQPRQISTEREGMFSTKKKLKSFSKNAWITELL